ncbi:hypothetical protein ONZ45_g632 [Pleurotus djamor]|nr:hypothetical protein ONZ45_g632 [Pleurotus djamor]
MLTSLLLLFLFVVVADTIRRRQLRRELPLPPGPSRLPFVGNLFSIPKTHQWLQYEKWAAEFSKWNHSDILYTEVCGTPNIILNTFEAANDLLNRRSAIYSDRPRLRMMEMMGQNFNFGVLPYGDEWRARRRIFWQEYMPANAPLREPIQSKHTKNLLRLLLRDPDSFLGHIRYSLGSSIMEMSYGITPLPKNDPFIALGDKVTHFLKDAPIFGAFLIDLMPAIQHLPSWFPGAAFKEAAHASYLADDETASPCFATRAVTRLRGLGMTADDEAALKDAIATGSDSGGIETTPSALASFFAGMLCYPEVQIRAQEELDAVLDRLPELTDSPSLPYIHAVMLEVLRWQVVIPLGVSHAIMSNDEYRGFRIPANCAVTVNLWAILNDPVRFPDPREFRPERFLQNDHHAEEASPRLEDIVMACFGFGRRICPGRSLALDSLWLVIASVLYTFDITKPDGVTVAPEIEYEPLFIR